MATEMALRNGSQTTPVQVTPASGQRDLRLDFFRGLALFCIFIDHIPDNLLGRFTLQSIGLSDAAEVFILISGYTAGMVYGREIDRRGMLIGTVRIYQRVWLLYVAHVFLFMLFMAMVAHTASVLNTSVYSEEFGAADFIKEPDVAVMQALILNFQPAFMDILPLYILLLAGLPFALAVGRKLPWLLIGGSFLVWLGAQVDDRVALQAYPGPDQLWFFNPFAWQFLFYVSAWVGWKNTRGGVPLLGNPWLFRVAVAVALAGFIIRVDWQLNELVDEIPALFTNALWPLSSKTDLGVIRLLNVFAWAIVAARLMEPQASYLKKRWARPFMICGRNSLYVFCFGILLSVTCHMVLNEYYGGLWMQLAVVATGILLMVGLAAWIDWFGVAKRAVASPGTRAPAPGGGE
jgi:hypothetical protein